MEVLRTRLDFLLEEPLEWVGDVMDLQTSNEQIPRYVRSLMEDGETLEDIAQSSLRCRPKLQTTT